MVLMNICFCAVLIILSLVDLKHMILPTFIIRVGICLGIGFKLLLSMINHDWSYLWEALIGGGIGYIWFYLLYHIARKVMHREEIGFGDVRLMGMIGIFIGGWQLCIMVLMACMMASVVGVVLLMIRRKNAPYPFGPFLCGATMLLLWVNRL